MAVDLAGWPFVRISPPPAGNSTHGIVTTPPHWFDDASNAATVAFDSKRRALYQGSSWDMGDMGDPAGPCLELRAQARFAVKLYSPALRFGDRSEHEVSPQRRWAGYDRHADAFPCDLLLQPYGRRTVL